MTREHKPLLLGVGGIFAVTLFFLVTQSSILSRIFSIDGFEPHGHCFLWMPSLLRVYTVSDLLIGMSYMAISLILIYLVHKSASKIPFDWVFVAFGAFIFSCGVTHFMDIITVWTPTYWLAGGAKVMTALASVATAVALPPLVPKVLGLVDSLHISEARKQQLQESYRALEAEVNERRRVEEELRATLQREQRLSEFRANFITRMSHEFRTPLAIARSSSDMIKHYKDRLTDEQRNDRIDQIQAQIYHMTLLLDDILMVGRMEAGRLELHPEIVDLDTFCRERISELQMIVEDTHHLNYTGSTLCLHANADPKLLQQIVTNLLHNAIKYSPEGGDIEIILRCDDDVALLSIRDQGIGIPEKDHEHIFEAFYRASNTQDVSGTGLGLAIVKQAVEMHGGSIEIESNVGEGTEVNLRLPLYADEHDG